MQMSMIVRKPINRCLSIQIKGNEKRLSMPSAAVREIDECRLNFIEISLCTLMERRQLISGSFSTGEATLSKMRGQTCQMSHQTRSMRISVLCA